MFRELYEEIRDHGGVPRRNFDEERRWLDAFGKRPGIPSATPEELWELYALSRVADLLRIDGGYAEFMDALGLQRIERRAFHPFFHEIVTVGDAFAEVWPGYMLGALLIARAGVVADADFPKEIAETSLLHWAYLRANRRTTDLSVGWGHNSQWRTAFRRDYLLNGVLHYNVDGRRDKQKYDEDLTPDEKLELLRHRCFVRCRKRHDDRWPYDDTYREPFATSS